MKNSPRLSLCIFMLILFLNMKSSVFLPSAQASTPEQENNEKNALILLGTAFGFNFFDFNSTLVENGWNVTIAGTHEVLAGCFNRDPTSVTADLLIEDLSDSDIAHYKCVVIPSGGHHSDLSSKSYVKNLLTVAHAKGAIIATLCVTEIVLAYTPGLMDGVNVAYVPYASAAMRNAGANILYEDVVVSKNIITGGSGGGPNGGGSTAAPTVEVCTAIDNLLIENQANAAQRTKNIIIGAVSGTLVLGGALTTFLLLRKKKMAQ